VVQGEADQKVVIRPDILAELHQSVSFSSKIAHIYVAEKNGKAWAMVKVGAKPRKAPKKRKYYEIIGFQEEDEKPLKVRKLDPEDFDTNSSSNPGANKRKTGNFVLPPAPASLGLNAPFATGHKDASVSTPSKGSYA